MSAIQDKLAPAFRVAAFGCASDEKTRTRRYAKEEMADPRFADRAGCCFRAGDVCSEFDARRSKRVAERSDYGRSTLRY